MLEAHRPVLEALPHETLARMWASVHARHPGRIPPPASGDASADDFLRAAERGRIFSAEVVMALASDPTPLGLQALEALVGRPLTRAPDPSPRAETDEALRARAMLIAKTAEERRNIAVLSGAHLDATAASYGLTRLNASPAQEAKREELRKRRVRDPRVVEWVAPNPRRPGSKAHAAFACWRAGDTVDQCLERGLPARYIGKSVKKGWVKLGAIRR